MGLVYWAGERGGGTKVQLVTALTAKSKGLVSCWWGEISRPLRAKDMNLYHIRLPFIIWGGGSRIKYKLRKKKIPISMFDQGLFRKAVLMSLVKHYRTLTLSDGPVHVGWCKSRFHLLWSGCLQLSVLSVIVTVKKLDLWVGIVSD